LHSHPSKKCSRHSLSSSLLHGSRLGSLPVHPWRLLPFLGPAPARAQDHGSTSLRSAHFLCPALLFSLHGRQQQGATSSHGAHAPCFFSMAPSRCSLGRAPWEHVGALLFSMAKSPGAGAPSPWSLPSLRVWGCRQELLPWPPTPCSPPWPAPSSSALLLSFPMAPISSSLSLLSMVSSRVPSLFSSWRELPAPSSTANRGQRRPSSPIAWSSGFPLPARPRHRAGKSQRPAAAHPMDGAQKIPAGAPSFSPARSPSRSSSSPHLPSLRSSSAKRRCSCSPGTSPSFLAATTARMPSARHNVEGDMLLQHAVTLAGCSMFLAQPRSRRRRNPW
jgi:hypothetical protein